MTRVENVGVEGAALERARGFEMLLRQILCLGCPNRGSNAILRPTSFHRLERRRMADNKESFRGNLKKKTLVGRGAI